MSCAIALPDRLTFNAHAKAAWACEGCTDKTAFTIAEIERAINYWCAREAPSEDGALCAKARPLAEIDGLVNSSRANSLEVSKLNDDLLDAIPVALYQQQTPL